MEGDWQPSGGRQETAGRLPPVEPGRVVGLGAVCDVDPPRDDPRDQGFTLGEFVTLDDGRRVLLNEDRGFTIGIRSTGEPRPRDVRRGLTVEQLTRDALLVVLPDDDDDPEPHPWSWLAELAQSRGLDVSADDLRELPYEVVLTDELRRWLAAYAGSDDG